MNEIASAIAAGRDIVFEGACGTGKTLSALIPALAHAQEHNQTVVITTNVHQQMRQFVEEARAIATTHRLQAVVFKGKASMCHLEVGYDECQVLRDTTRRLIETTSDIAELESRERELIEKAQAGNETAIESRAGIMEELQSKTEVVSDVESDQICSYFRQNIEEDTSSFYHWLFDNVRLPEEIFQYAERHGFCGYELLKEGMHDVDLVICNYHHLLDPFIRKQFFRWIGQDPSDVISIFDEAHNLESAARKHATKSVASTTIAGALDEIDSIEDNRSGYAYDLISAFDRAVSTVLDQSAVPYHSDDWSDLPIDSDNGRDDVTMAFLNEYTGRGIDRDIEGSLALGEDVDQQFEDAYRTGERPHRRRSRILQVASFIDEWMTAGQSANWHPLLSVKSDPGRNQQRVKVELYNCIPESVTRSLFAELYSTILMSATLQPFSVLEDVLGVTDPQRLEYGLPFPLDRRRTFTVSSPPLFSSDRDDPRIIDQISTILLDSIRMTPGKSLCFFPSYAEASRYRDQLVDQIPDPILLDRSDTDVESIKQDFFTQKRGALFTSLWGTLTEGVSFDGDAARSVVIVGVPYPTLDTRREAVQLAFDQRYNGDEIGWQYAVEIPTIRKVRQAIGRVVRSPDDFGVRILVDDRYTASGVNRLGKYSVHSTFPAAERNEMIDVEPAKLQFAIQNFYSDLGAYRGDPPKPRIE